MKEKKLKPCPFCGHINHNEAITWQIYHQEYFVTCYKCKSRGPSKKVFEKAITAWNKREK
jgi:Lar family restriction alleviation protein